MKLIKLGLIWVQFLAESMQQTEVNGINNENCFSMFQFIVPIQVSVQMVSASSSCISQKIFFDLQTNK